MKHPSTALSTLASVALAATLFSGAIAQSPSTQPPPASSAATATTPPLAFEIADVHPSAQKKATYMSGGRPHGDRFVAHNATIVELVSIAYAIEDSKVLGGPSWLDTDRFDIAAKVPHGTSDDDVRQMLRSLLADRFKLVLHNDTKPLASMVMTAPKGSSRLKPSELKPSDGSSGSGCKTPPAPTGPPSNSAPATFSCRGESMAAFALFLHQQVLWQIFQPIVDTTNLKGTWDFDFKAIYPSKNADDCAAIVSAIDSQLGLKLTPGTSPMPILIIDSVNETPTPNPPGIATVLPPPPPTEFDVATIKPTGPDNKGLMGRIGRDQIDVTGITLLKLINFAWDFNAPMIANPPKWLDQDKFDVLAKVAPPDPSAGPGGAPDLSFEDFQKMTRKLIEDRFNFKWHMEDRPADAYVLLATSPKLKKADPLYRSGCKQGPGRDGKDPRILTPILGRLLSCQNATMAQFVDFLFQVNNGYIKTALFDGTGLSGTYDFDLSFSGYSQIGGINDYSLPSGPPGESGSSAAGADPNGAIPLFDAIKQQLGLKIEKQKRSIPMLVIDHIDEKPTDN
jgi:uncharacterized protein (TIGR03435 family)